MTQKQLHVFFLFLWICTSAIAQNDIEPLNLSEFKVLKSAGPIPEDFLLLSSEKYATEKKKNDATDKKEKKVKDEFYKKSSFEIDNLLLSGDVLFGDPVTNYINKVADNLLKDEPELRKKLRFYTIKSNVTNAFCSDPGIIFISTGLISQLENEAQLAFVLSHEIAHYTQNHHVENYIEGKKLEDEYKNESDQIKKYSQYSKQNELEADQLGAKRYINQTNYAPSEILSTFNVLQFSDLPFDEIEVKKNYYNIGGNYVPEEFFSDTVPSISVSVDIDKYENSTHPNIDKRRDQINELYPNLEDTKNYFIVYDKSNFEKIRDLCRFQNVYNNITNLNYEAALYEILILKNQYPNNRYLDISECKALTGYAMYNNANERNEVTENLSDIEGESYRLFNFYRSLKDEQFLTLIAKTCFTLTEKHQEDPDFIHYTQLAFTEWIKGGKVKSFEYGYHETAEIIKNAKNQQPIETADTTESKQKTTKLSKYDKILSGAVIIDSISYPKKYGMAVNHFDPENFHLYAFHQDLDKPLFQKLKSNALDHQDEEHETEFGSRYLHKKLKIDDKVTFYGSDTIIVLNPVLKRWTEKEGGQHLYAEKQLKKLIDFTKENAKNLDLHVEMLALKEIDKNEVERFNAAATLYDFIGEVIAHSDNLNVNYYSQIELLKEYAHQYGSTKILLPFVHSIREKENYLKLLWCLTGVCIPIIVKDMLTPEDNTIMMYLLFDTKSNQILMQDFRFFKKKPTNGLLRIHNYDILHQIKTKPVR